MIAPHLQAERAARQAEEQQQRTLLPADLRRQGTQIVDPRQ